MNNPQVDITDNIPKLIPFYDLLYEYHSTGEVTKTENNDEFPNNQNSHLVSNSLVSINSQFHEGKIAFSFEKSMIALPVQTIIKSLEFIDDSSPSHETTSINSTNSYKINNLDYLINQFLNECSRKFKELRDVLSSTNRSLKKGSNIIILEPNVLNEISQNFIEYLENYIDRDVSFIHSSNLCFFYPQENRFLRIQPELIQTRKSRITQYLNKVSRDRSRYRYKIKTISQKTSFYLLFLSKLLEKDVVTVREYIDKLNSNYPGGSLQFVAELEHSLLNTMYEQGIYTLDGNDGIPDVEILKGYRLGSPNEISLEKSQTRSSSNKEKNNTSENNLSNNNFQFNEDNIDPSFVLLGKQAKENPENIHSYINSSNRVSLLDDEVEKSKEERILKIWPGSMKLSNFKYRSNASMKGKFILTNKRLIAYRKKFGFFPSIPFIGYVRPNNRMTILFLRILNFLSKFRRIMTAIIRSVGFPVILGLLIGFKSFGKYLQELGISFPSLSIPGLDFVVNFVIENPEGAAAIGGSLGGLSYLIIRLIRLLFFRSRAIVVLPLPMIKGIQARPKNSKLAQLVCKLKGSDKLPGLKHGLPFKLSFNSHSVSGVPGLINDQSSLLTMVALI